MSDAFQVLTPWFPASVKPLLDGEYLTRASPEHAPMLLKWNGFAWKYCDGRDANVFRREWRGLAFDPSTSLTLSDGAYVCFEVPQL